MAFTVTSGTTSVPYIFPRKQYIRTSVQRKYTLQYTVLTWYSLVMSRLLFSRHARTNATLLLLAGTHGPVCHASGGTSGASVEGLSQVAGVALLKATEATASSLDWYTVLLVRQMTVLARLRLWEREGQRSSGEGRRRKRRKEGGGAGVEKGGSSRLRQHGGEEQGEAGHVQAPGGNGGRRERRGP